MSEIAPQKPHRSPAEVIRQARRYAARIALVAGILAFLALGFSGFGVHEEMFDLDYAVWTLAIGWAPALALVAAVLGGASFFAAILIPPRKDVITSLLALFLAASTFAGSAEVKARSLANPPIHEVATDWTEPLMFGPAASAARGEGANRVYADPRVQAQPQAPNLTGTRIAEVNARSCPGAVPAVITGSPEDAYAKARSAMLREGMTLVTENPAAGRIEALAVTKWLKLKGDVLVRVRAEGAGARVDIRSISRTGLADLGENCRRVTRLRAAMAK